MASDSTSNGLEGGFVACVTIVFVIVALQLLFPSNVLLPLDRRASTILGAIWIMILFYLFPSQQGVNIGSFVDFDVLIVLAAIMVINFILLRQPFLAHLEHKMQELIQRDRNVGFLVVSVVSLLVSPVIMNDGLCLMLVHPVLDAFPPRSTANSEHAAIKSAADAAEEGAVEPLREESAQEATDAEADADALFYMLNIACSANIGSALTFSGNPQNLLVAQHLSKLLSGGVFFALMVVPVLVSWVITLGYLQLCREAQRRRVSVWRLVASTAWWTRHPRSLDASRTATQTGGFSPVGRPPLSSFEGDAADDRPRPARPSAAAEGEHREGATAVVSAVSGTFTCTALLMIIALEFQGALSLTGVFAGVAMSLLAALYLARYYPVCGATVAQAWRERKLLSLLKPASAAASNDPTNDAAQQAASEHDDAADVAAPSAAAPSRRLQRLLRRLQRERNAIAESLEVLVRELDVNLLLIFTGLFIVSGAFVTTQIPRHLWDSLATSGGGGGAFQSWSSIAVLSTYIVTASQLVGNVPVVYMARDQVAALDRRPQILGWLLLAFVSTVAGNFTLVGSAANIIVAEKSRRHGARPVSLDAPFHFAHCGAVTALSIVVGAVLLVLEVQCFL